MATNSMSIAGVEIPKGLERGGYRPSRRDARNNIMVHFLSTGPPADGSDLLDVRQLPGELGGGVSAVIFPASRNAKA